MLSIRVGAFMRGVIAIILSCLATSAAAQPSFAPVYPAGSDRLNESFDKERDVSTGTPLVGLVIGMPTGAYPAEAATLSSASLASGDRLCVHQTSRDGRYSSSNPYAPVGEAGAAPVVAPLSEAFPDVLGSYPADEVGFLAYRAAGPVCGLKDALFLPRVLDDGVAGPLMVYAASRTRDIRAALAKPDGPMVTGACAPTPRPAVTFDVACRFDDFPEGRVQLVLSFDDGFAVEDRLYDLSLPKQAAP